jgi:hypothetical protein
MRSFIVCGTNFNVDRLPGEHSGRFVESHLDYRFADLNREGWIIVFGEEFLEVFDGIGKPMFCGLL